ncbi:MAG: hypothetical protein AB3N34_00650 [Lettuce witches'-broom phytoplasma]
MGILDYLINPSENKRIKSFLKEKNNNNKTNKKLRSIIKHKPISSEEVKIVTHKSVFVKFFISVFLFFITILFFCYRFSNYAISKDSFEILFNLFKCWKINLLAFPIEIIENDWDLYMADFFLMMGIVVLISIIYIISFYFVPSSLRCVHWVYVIAMGSLARILIGMFRTFCLSFIDVFFFLFVIPTSLMFFILLFMTFLYKRQKIKVNDDFRSFLKMIFGIYWFINLISFYYYLHYCSAVHDLLCITLMIIVGMIIDVFGLIVISLL